MAPVGSKLSFQQLVDAMLYKATRCAKPSRLHKYSAFDLDSMEQKLQISMSLIRGVRNLMQPIHKLPPELLTLIFHQTQTHLSDFLPISDSPSSSAWNWLALTRVCRHWRGLIATSSYLWSTLDSATLPERFLKRSGGVPLKVYLGFQGSDFSEEIVGSITTQSWRFRELHLDDDSWMSEGGPTIFHRFTSPAPMLTSLTLVTNGRDISDGALPQMFSDQMPFLRKLCLKHFTSWSSGYFQNLTHLCLYDQNESTRPTMAEFLNFLEGSPLLEELALVRAGPAWMDASNQGHILSSRTVSLSHLRQLDIGEWPSSRSVGRFLSHIQLPPQADLYLWGNDMLNAAENLAFLFPEDISKLENMKHIKRWYFARQPRVILDTPFVSVTGTEGGVEGRTLYMYGTFSASQLLPSQLLSRYPVSEVESLAVRDSCTNSGSADSLNVAFWREVLERLPALKNIEILAFRSIGFTRAVVSALMPQEDMLSSLLCPELISLTIEHDVSLPAYFIRSVVEARAQAARLEKLRVLVYDPNFQHAEQEQSDGASVAESNWDSDESEATRAVNGTTHAQTREEEEYRRHTEDDRKLLEECIGCIGNVQFEYGVPLSVGIVPEAWPTRAFNWTRRRRGS